MGRSSSKLMKAPNNPLEELQYKETQRELRKRLKEKEQKQIAKLQKKHNKKKHAGKKHKNSLTQRQQDQQHGHGSSISGRRKSSTQQRCSSSLNDEIHEHQQQRITINMDEYNHQIEQKTQKQMEENLCAFLMNQIALTQEFAANYEREVTNICAELLNKESEFNQLLEEHSILLANPLDAIVAKHLQFRRIHGLEKNVGQLLQPQTLYVVFDNIDISRPNDANYDSISPLCKVDMDTEFFKTTPCKEDYQEMLREIKWKGYVRLRLREDQKKTQAQAGAEIYTDSSSGYSTTSLYSGKSSGYGSENDYDYAYITHLNTHHPLRELKLNSQRDLMKLNSKVLPEACVTKLGNFIEPWQEHDTDEEEEEESEDEENDDEEESDGYEDAEDTDEHIYTPRPRQLPKPEEKTYENQSAAKAACDMETLVLAYRQEQEKRKQMLQQSYLNSKEFMRYFGELMRQKLAPLLQISTNELLEGSYRGACIYTKRFELIPAVHVQQNAQSWPDCAFSFRIRDRPVSTSSLTGKQFQWPTRAMIKRIESFGFHVIPMGYAPKRQKNPFRDIEWRIVFPKAERYLERQLTNTQVKVFMLTKALIRTFVEPKEENKALMFALDHLRTHLFWECERNFTAWPEEFLGDVLIRFISSFMLRLREKCLRDYFIEERNLFESIPEYSLITLHAILVDIVSNPLMHLMVAMRYLQHAEHFFPKLNFKRIFANLRENDMLKLKQLAKHARTLVDLTAQEEEQCVLVDDGAKGLVGIKKHREKTTGKLRRKTHLMRHHIEVKKKQEEQMRRRSIESIDVEFFFNRNIQPSSQQLANNPINQGLENLRRTNLLEVLLDHLIQMAECAIEMRSNYQAKTYLQQAKRLCKFYHNYGCDMNAKEYLASVRLISESLADNTQLDDFDFIPPALPMRSSIEPPPQLTKPTSTQRDESTESAIMVDITTAPVFEKSRGAEQVDCEQKSTPDNAEDNDSVTGTPQPRKSIRIMEHVVEIHAGDLNPMQNADCNQPISILRKNDAEQKQSSEETEQIRDNEDEEQLQQREENDCDDGDESVEETDPPLEGKTAAYVAHSPALTAALKHKFNAAAGLIRNTHIANLKAIQSLSSSTEKLMVEHEVKEKCLHLTNSFWSKTIQLKEALNQSSIS